jgi:acetyl-CoA acyltransferase 2
LSSHSPSFIDETSNMAAAALSGIFVVGAKRTPFGAFGGAFKNVSATELAVVATRSALQQASLDPTRVDAAICGNVIPSSPDGAYLARHVALKSGCKIQTPAVTVNRLCGSGFESVIQGAQYVALNMAQVVICAGTENMSQAPLQVQGQLARWGTPLGKGLHMRDALWDGLTDAHVNTPMGMTAENLAQQYNITREVCNCFVCGA